MGRRVLLLGGRRFGNTFNCVNRKDYKGFVRVTWQDNVLKTGSMPLV